MGWNLAHRGDAASTPCADRSLAYLITAGLILARRRLVLSGIANGYRFYIVADACGGLGLRSEEAAFRRFVAAGAVMSSFVSLAGEWAGDFSQPKGRAAVEVIYRMIGAGA